LTTVKKYIILINS